MNKHFDYIVIGGGSGGIASANEAALCGKRVALVEASDYGGACVNVGCVPKKVMWNASQIKEGMEKWGPVYGLSGDVSFRFKTLVKHRESYIKDLNKTYEKTLKKNKVTLLKGSGKFTGSNSIEVKGKTYTADHILIATGGKPELPDIPGAEHAMDSNGLFALKELPKRMAVVGGGYVGVQFAGILQAFGVDIHLFLRQDVPLCRFDPLISKTLMEIMERNEMKLHFRSVPKEIHKQKDGSLLLLAENGEKAVVDGVLFTTGRAPRLETLNLSACGVELNENGFIKVDDYQNTSVPGIYAIGDVTGTLKRTPIGIMAGCSLAKRLFSGKPDEHFEPGYIPTVVFSHPPIGMIGLTEEEAKAKYGAAQISVYTAAFDSMRTAIADQKEPSRLKLVCLGPHEEIIGLHGIGSGMDELLQGFVVAMNLGATKADFDQTVAIHPTSAEEFVTMK